MSDAALIQDMQEARKFCESVNISWPSASKDGVLWWTPSKTDAVVWQLTKSSEGAVDAGDLKSHTTSLLSLKTKLLALGQEKFNVVSTVPTSTRLIEVTKWPGKVTKVRRLWISPSSSIEEAIEQVIKEVGDLWRDESLVLHGFPLSQDFCVNVLYVIGHLFSKVGLVYPQGLCTTFAFYGYCTWNMSSERLLKRICAAVKDGEMHKLSITPNSQFYRSKFYEYCLRMDCMNTKQQVFDILASIQTARKSLNNKILEHLDLCTEQDEMSLYSEEKCMSPECISKQSNGKSAQGCSVFCKQQIYRLEMYSFYIEQIALQSNDCSDWQYFSGLSAADLQVVKEERKRSFNPFECNKFCLKQLLYCQSKLNQIVINSLQLTDEDISNGSCLTHNEDIMTSMKRYSWSETILEVKVLDFGRELWMNVNDNQFYQVPILRRVVLALDDVWKGECLELRGLPLLSEFTVSLVYLVSHLFEKVRFSHSRSGRNSLFFFNFLDSDMKVKEHLVKALPESGSLVSLVPSRKISSGDFYKKVKTCNNLSLKKQCLHNLKVLSMKDDEFYDFL